MPLGRSLLALSLAVEQILEQPKVLLLQAKILSQQPFDHAGKFPGFDGNEVAEYDVLSIVTLMLMVFKIAPIVRGDGRTLSSDNNSLPCFGSRSTPGLPGGRC